MTRMRFSLFTKIMLWFFLNLLLLAGALWLVFSFSFQFDATFFDGLTNKMDTVARLIREEVNGKTRAEQDEILKRYTEAYGVELFLFDNQGRQLAGREITLPMDVTNELLYPESGPKAVEGVPGQITQPQNLSPPPRPRRPPLSIYVRTTNPTLYWSGSRVMLTERGNPEPIRARVLAVSDSMSGHGLFFDITPWLMIGIIIIVGSTLFWLPFIRNITKTIGQISAATEKIAEEDFDVRVSEARTDELGRLGKGVNHLANRLSGFVYGQKRFLGDISHELNSPLARMQFALSILEDRVDKRNLDYVEDVKEEVVLMSKLVAELLEFSKAGIKAPQIKLETFRLRPLVERVVERETANEMSEIEIAVDKDIEVSAQPELLARALANVLRNAVRYAGSAGKISIAAENGYHQVKIIIADEGLDVPDASLEKLFDPLYRIESDRSRQTGGTGLGLAIVKTCVEACQGKVFAENLSPNGFAISILLKN
jgi:two-component system, OmpR family, sensor histidine kinase CpxA